MNPKRAQPKPQLFLLSKEETMFVKRMLISILAVSALALASGSTSMAIGSAQPRLQDQGTSLNTLMIPYSGRLTGQTEAEPVADGAYDLSFTLYNAETAGTSLWSEILTGVTVQDGDFTIFLGSVNPLSTKILGGQELWLAASVRGPGESAFTDLSPRQRLINPSNDSPSGPTAGPACPHDHWGEVWSGTGGKTGLDVVSSGGYALEGWSSGNIGVLGVSTGSAIIIPSGMTGLYGIGDNYGVEGYGNHGAYFSGYDDNQDLILGGDVGRINANSSANSQLYLSSNADAIIKLDNDGGGNNVLRIKNSSGSDACTIDEAGNLACAGSKTGYVADIAQNDDSTAITNGDVVAISGVGPAVLGEIPVIKVHRATDTDASAIIGVVDQHYLLDAQESLYEDGEIAPGEYLTLVTLGAYKAIKVDASYGAIKPGDLLVASPHAGYAMRAVSLNSGTIVGKALGELQSGTCTIAVMVTLQ
jgi:hypothetical protein